MVDGGIDDGFVEEESGIGLSFQMVGDFVEVGVEADAEERLAFADEVDELLTVHGILGCY